MHRNLTLNYMHLSIKQFIDLNLNQSSTIITTQIVDTSLFFCLFFVFVFFFGFGFGFLRQGFSV